jgi:hypothetical protein
VRGGDGALVVRQKGLIEKFVQKPIFNMIDRYFQKPVANIIKRILTELGIKTVVEKVIAAFSIAILSLDSYAIGAAIGQASPYCHIRIDKEFMENLERELRKRLLHISVIDCKYRFQYAAANLSPADLTQESMAILVNSIDCDEGRFVSKSNYIRCIACFLGIILELKGINRNNAVVLILEKIVYMVKSGRMSKEIADLLFKLLMSRGILPPHFKFPLIPKLPELLPPLLGKY